MDPAAQPEILTFLDTVLLHRAAVGGHRGTGYAQTKTLPNTNDHGAVLVNTHTVGGLNLAATTLNQEISNGMTYLECWRPLIYEPRAMLQAMCDGQISKAGTRDNRIVSSLICTGAFKIRMREGINHPDLWTETSQIIPTNVVDPTIINGVVQYGGDGFSHVQYVRAICILVRDMGQGYGLTQGSTTTTLQVATNPNFRNDEASGVGDGSISTCNNHLLAPSLGDIFDGVDRDPDGDYIATTSIVNTFDEDYNNENMIHWKYKTNNARTSTPEFAQVNGPTDDAFMDPLRGSMRKRNFHVLHDKKFAFKAGGSQSARVDGPGAKEVKFNWSIKLKNIRFQQPTYEANSTTANRSREQMSQRVFWYFIPSISSFVDCKNRANRFSSASPPVIGTTQRRSLGHHNFSVERYPEKVFWTEKESN